MPRLVTTRIDDTDSRFIYEGAWVKHKDAHEYGKSSHLAHETATAKLKFRGSSIAVYGTLASSQESQADPEPPISVYHLEDGFSSQYRAHSTLKDQYQSQFFRIDNLPFGEHTLVVTNAAHKDMFMLDYVEIIAPSQSLPIGLLVGTVVGSVLMTILLVLGIIWYRRTVSSRSSHGFFAKREDSLSSTASQNQGDGSIVPYNLDNPPPEQSVWSRVGRVNPLAGLNPKSCSRDLEAGYPEYGQSGLTGPRSIQISVCCDSCVAAGPGDSHPPPYNSRNPPGPSEPPV